MLPRLLIDETFRVQLVEEQSPIRMRARSG